MRPAQVPLFSALPLIAAVALLGCSSSSGSGGGQGSPSGDDSGAGSGGAVDAGAGDPGGGSPDAASEAGQGTAGAGGSGTATGMVNGQGFGNVATAFFIGQPDDPATTAIYLVDAPLTCAQVASSGWSHTIPTNTHIFEMILYTENPPAGMYTPSSNASATGQAEVNFVVAMSSRNETRASGGTIQLSTFTAMTAAAGTFNITWPDGKSTLEGSFDAVFCPNAHEP